MLWHITAQRGIECIVWYFVISIKKTPKYFEISNTTALSKSELKFHRTESFVSAALKTTYGYKMYDLVLYPARGGGGGGGVPALISTFENFLAT